MTLVMLERIEMDGKAAQFARGRETFFLALRGSPAPDAEKFAAGDVFAVAEGVDAESGDLVVWWTGAERTQALARVQEDLTLRPVAGFPAPARHPTPAVRGVVVGRLRQLGAQ
jgi:hypothetical protein